MKEICMITLNGLRLIAILVNPYHNIAYCQERLVKVTYDKVTSCYKEIKSIDVLPLLEENKMW